MYCEIENNCRNCFEIKPQKMSNATVEQKLKAIEVLENSNTFPDGEIVFQILRYLAKLGKDQKKIKSATIAADILGVDQGYNSNNSQDSYIRNKVHVLRKNLTLFYYKEGANEEYQLSIPKGSYRLELTKKELSPTTNTPQTTQTAQSEKSIPKKNVWGHYPLLICLSLLILSLSYIVFLKVGKNYKESFSNSLIPLLVSESEKLDIIVGSKNMYREFDVDMNRFRYIYDVDFLNDLDQVKEMQTLYPQKKITETGKAYHVNFETMQLASSIDLYYKTNGIKTSIIRSNIVEGIKHNAVVIGKYTEGTLGYLSNYFSSSRFITTNYGKNKNISKITHFKKNDNSLLPLLTLRKNKRYIGHSDYCIIKKVKTENEKEIVFLLSGSNFAQDFIYQNIYSSSFQEEIQEAFQGEIPNNFELLIEVANNPSFDVRHKVIYNSFLDVAN